MTRRLTAALLAGTLLVTPVAVATATATPALAAAVATATPLRYALPGTGTVTDVLAAGADVWVAAGDSVHLVSAGGGTVRRTVPGIAGARGLTLAPDRRSVYVSASAASTIVQLGLDGTVLGSWASHDCPGTSAVVGGALYYAYGCDTAGIGRLDLGTHEDTVALADAAGAGELTGAGATLVTYTSGGSGWPLTSYTVGDDGSLTPAATVRTSTVYDAEVSPDGAQVLTTDYTDGYGVARYDTATLTRNGVYPTGAYPDAVAWAPDGRRFAAVLHAAAPVTVYAVDGTLLTTTTGSTATGYRNEAHRAAWSPDGRYVYSLDQESGPAYLVVTPAAGQARAALSVTVKAAAAYAGNATVTVRTAGRPGTAVRVTVTQNGSRVARTVTTDRTGTATWTLPARANGTVAATTAVTLTHLATAASAKFGTPSAVRVTMVGATRVTKGVAHYPSIRRVQADVQILPRRAGRTTVALQHRSGKKWITDQVAGFPTAADGTSWLGLARGNRKMTYRFLVRADAGAVAGASPAVASASFTVD